MSAPGRARLQPRGLAACAVAVGVAVVGLAAACHDEPEVHIYSGQLFEGQRRCLEPSPTALDILSGPGAPACAAACLVESALVYVSSECPPYPPGFAVEMQDAAVDAADPCAAALHAFRAGIACDGGGGD